MATNLLKSYFPMIRTRLESFLSELLQRKVTIKEVLPNNSTRLSDESFLLITDIIVELEDGTLAGKDSALTEKDATIAALQSRIRELESEKSSSHSS